MSVYCYGMCTWSTVHRVLGCLPPENGYGEIVESWRLPAGEATNGAILMSAWREAAWLDGAMLGRATRAPLLAALDRHGVDASRLRDAPDVEGFTDIVLTNGSTRSVFGRFSALLSDGLRRCTAADPEAIARCRMALVDPCFSADSRRAARLCFQAGVPCVVLDCRHDDPLHHHAAATVLSREFRREHYPNAGDAELLSMYTVSSAALTVFTQGSEPVRFARGSGPQRSRHVAQVEARVTIGAGDAFRAGIAYGLLHGLRDEACVEFALAAAGCVCSRGPIAASPPRLDEVAAARALALHGSAAPGAVLV
jgi:sugar/nucleoside kinase (ribokinase family)